MPRRFEHFEADPAEIELVAVVHRRERVLGARPRAQVDPRALPVAQLQVARHEIGVEVREEDVADAAPERPSRLEIAVDVALRIDDRRLAALLIGDQI